MGGGSRQDAAFQWLCERTNGGDFLVLSARDDEAYLKKVNAEIKAVRPLNSVATLSFSSRDDSADPKIVHIIDQAETIFWPAVTSRITSASGKTLPCRKRLIVTSPPVNLWLGSSAGLAVMGEFSFSSMIDTIHSPEALGESLRQRSHADSRLSAHSLACGHDYRHALC